jgi:hypothetical protein
MNPATADSQCFRGWIWLLCSQPPALQPAVIGECQFARRRVLSRRPNNSPRAVTRVTLRGPARAQVT